MVNRLPAFTSNPSYATPSILPLTTTLVTGAPGQFLWSLPAFGADQGVIAAHELIDLAGRLEWTPRIRGDWRDVHKRESCRCLENW
jgi:hypothetical protein